MPVNYFEGLSEDELIEARDGILRRLSIGDINFVTIPGGGQSGKTWTGSVPAKVALLMVKDALYALDPDRYTNDHRTQLIRRTFPSYC